MLQPNPCGVEAGEKEEQFGTRKCYSRTLVGLKRPVDADGVDAVVQLQPNPCGVEAPDPTKSRQGRYRLQPNPCGVEANYYTSLDEEEQVTAEPLWG